MQLPDAERNDQYLLVRCMQCRLLFIDNTPDDLTPHYFLDDGHEMSKVRNSALEWLREQLLYRDASSLLRVISRNDTVLDLGCGDGALVRILRKHGYGARGADVHDGTRLSFLRENYFQLSDFNPDSLMAALTTIQPSVVIMRHVLEHVPMPGGVIEAFRNAGVRTVLIVVPNVESKMRRFFGANWFYWDPPRHLSFFSPETLRDTFDRAGYKEIVSEMYGLDEVAVSIYRAMRIYSYMHRTLPGSVT